MFMVTLHEGYDLLDYRYYICPCVVFDNFQKYVRGNFTWFNLGIANGIYPEFKVSELEKTIYRDLFITESLSLL